jgi:glycosyltransferase involved in cell wall biosynthesis
VLYGAFEHFRAAMKIGYLMQAGVPDVRHRPASGAANHVIQVFRALRSRGHEMRLLAVLDGEIFLSDDLEVFRPVRRRWLDDGPVRLFERVVRRLQSELGLPWAALFDSVRFAAACRHLLAGVDVLYERMGWMGYGGMIASRWLGVPRVLEVNGDHPSELALLGMEPRATQRRLSMALMRRTAQRAAHVIASGAGWRQRFIERWGVSPAGVTVVENGSELVELLTRQRLGCFAPESDASEPMRFAFVGTFEPWSGVDVLLEGLSKALARGAGAHLLLIGSGREEEKMADQMTRLRLQSRVTRCGYLAPEALASRLATAQVGVSAYRGRVEYSGLKLYDYKAAGLATIASGADGQPASIEHGRTGWIVPEDDSNALADAIVRLSGEPALVREMGRKARLEAENRHSWGHAAQELERVLLEVARG